MYLITYIPILLVFTSASAQVRPITVGTQAEKPICVPIGTCLPREPGSVDVRVQRPDEKGKCPDGREVCRQRVTAVRCGFVYASNATTKDGPAPYGSHPWLAYITNQTGYTGSGVLLDRYHVLTAAHKVYRNKNSLQKLQVYIGMHNRGTVAISYKRVIEDMIVHPNFDPITLKNDLAVIRLKAHIPLGYMKNVGAACLPKSGASFIYQRCMVAGWGATEFAFDDSPTNNLKQVTVPIVPYDTCYQSMKNLLGASTGLFLDRDGEICAGGEAGKDACTEDGGAPLICRDETGKRVVAGLVIWGKGCGRANVYGVYVDVPKYVDWIQRAIRNLQA